MSPLRPDTQADPAAAPAVGHGASAPEKMRGLSIPGAMLEAADLRGFDLRRADLQGARLTGARLDGAIAHGACLRGAGLTGASAIGLQGRDLDLERALLAGAVLHNAVLCFAVLLEADLRGADLSGADLTGADLRGADLRDADLSGAELSGADLAGARLEGAKVEGVRGRRTRLHRVLDPGGEALGALIAAGGYQGLPPLFVEAGAASGRVGRASARLARASRDGLSRGLVPLWARLRAAAIQLRGRVAEGAAEARGRQERRNADAALRQARWGRIRAQREADRQRRKDAEVGERRSRSAERAARRLRLAQRRAGQRAPLVVLAASRPPSAPTSAVQAAAAERRRVALSRHRSQYISHLREDEFLELVRDEASARILRRASALQQAIDDRLAAAEAALQARLDAEEAARRAAESAEAAAAMAAAQGEQAEAVALARIQLQAQQAEQRAIAQAAMRAERARRAASVREGLRDLAQAAAALQARQAEARRLEQQALDRQQGGSRGRPSLPRPALADAASPTLSLAPSGPAALPQGPGVDLAGADLRRRRLGAMAWPEANLVDARLSGVRLEGADLRRAKLEGADFEGARLAGIKLDGVQGAGARLSGARMRRASLVGAQLMGAALVDVDLRDADLRDADLREADLTGADLRRCRLAGANLRGARLGAARMSDLDLRDVALEDASLDQADLAGCQWEGAGVRGADLAGALGLSGRERRALAERGARTGEHGLEELLGGLRSTQLRAALLILGLGLGAWLGARFLVGQDDPAVLAEKAAALRSEAPLDASAAYASLADLSTRVDERVGYLIEAAGLADLGGDAERAGALLDEALVVAGSSPGISADVRVRKGSRHLERGEWVAARETVLPLLGLEGHPAETRARAVVVWQEASAALDLAPADGERDPVAALYVSLAELPEAAADLYLAVAELRSGRGETALALAELDAATALDLPPGQGRRLQESKARVLDRAGALDEAAALYSLLAEAPDLSTPRAALARLALADIRQRQGRLDEAAALVRPLAETAGDAGVRGRALLLTGRLAEQAVDGPGALAAYQQVLSLPGIDADTRDEARISLARVLMEGGSSADAEAAIAGLPPEAAAMVMAHARLGEARALMDQGQAEAALDVYDALLENEALIDDLRRGALSGRAEALAYLGELPEATELWRELLAGNPDPAERAEIELRLAYGLLQGGEPTQADRAFQSLAAASDPDVRFRGLLGQAEVALSGGERARARGLYQQVADRAPDAAFQVQALQELALLSADEERPEAALEAWRRLLGVAPPGHPAIGTARLAVMLGLADLGRLDEALGICEQAVATTTGADRLRARAGCAELHERARHVDAARQAWVGLARSEGLPADLAGDAWLGAARCTLALARPAEAAALAREGLGQISALPMRLPLLSLEVEALQQVDAPEALAQALAQRDALVEAAPALAGPLLVQSAAQARSQGRPEEAARQLERALSLPLSPQERAGALVELGDTLLEAGDVAAAQARFGEVAAVEGVEGPTAFAAAMGLAEALRRQGLVEEALKALATLSPPDPSSRRWWLETRAGLQVEAGEGEAALATWMALVEASADEPAARTAALRGAADAQLGLDRPQAALDLYEQAAASATDAGASGWARLGLAAALAELDQGPRAQAELALLRGHADPEVQLQAALESARLFSVNEDWDSVLRVLAGVDATPLGPGWDASLVEVRVGAQVGSGDPDAAADAWTELSRRWPESEEALLPAWLGLADLALARGDIEEARQWADRAVLLARDPGYLDRARALVARLDGR